MRVSKCVRARRRVCLFVCVRHKEGLFLQPLSFSFAIVSPIKHIKRDEKANKNLFYFYLIPLFALRKKSGRASVTYATIPSRKIR